MTVSSTTSKNTYTGDAADVTFDFTFSVLDEAHILVQLKNTTTGVITDQTITTHYTVSGTGNLSGSTNYTTGTITFISAPSASEEVILSRNVPLTQATDYIENATFPAQTHESALDKLTMVAQQQDEQLDRSIKLDAAISGVASTITTATVTADGYLKLNSAGTGWEFITLSSTAGLGNVVEDTSPAFGGNMDVNGFSIVSLSDGNIVLEPNGTGNIQLNAADILVEEDIVHSGDTNNKIIFGTDTQDYQTGGSSRLDVSDSGVRLGGANARVTTVLDEDNMSSDSATALATQQSIKAYTESLGATQAQQETGSINSKYVTPGVQQYHPSAAKAWVRFQGSSTVDASYNVASVTDNGTGDYTVIIDTDLSSTSYCVALAFGDGSAVLTNRGGEVNNYLAASFDINTYVMSSGAANDMDKVSAVVYGDL